MVITYQTKSAKEENTMERVFCVMKETRAGSILIGIYKDSKRAAEIAYNLQEKHNTFFFVETREIL